MRLTIESMERNDKPLTWDQRVMAAIKLGVDESIIAANLRLTPTQRVEKMRRAALQAHELFAARRL